MSSDEVAKDIVISLIEQKLLVSVDAVCDAYKKIVKVVYNPND